MTYRDIQVELVLSIKYPTVSALTHFFMKDIGVRSEISRVYIVIRVYTLYTSFCNFQRKTLYGHHLFQDILLGDSH